jgi:hypothetical protein
MPISLIHAVAKIVAKLMATRFVPFVNTLFSQAQSAFIKLKASMTTISMLNYARRLHNTKNPALLLKLDIKKAFDSVRWDHLVDYLQKRGVPSKS